jgi:hypothetical protein
VPRAQDAANRDEDLSRRKKEARAAAPPEPLRPLKERMKEELEKGLKSEIDQRCDAPVSRVKELVLC